MAFTSMCPASQGASSSVEPVRMFTTPPGRSEVASTSAKVIAGSGARSAATTTQVLPVTITGAITLTSARSDAVCGAITATTPAGSGDDRLKYGPATGLAEPSTAAILSDQPAYQTSRSTAASTSSPARSRSIPSRAAVSAANCARRPSSISAAR